MREEVTFAVGGIPLAGVFEAPALIAGRKRWPAVVLSHGLANNRDEAGQHDYLSHKLVEHGYAVLRFDFRGCGRSGAPRGRMLIGSEWPEDLRAALSYLSQRPEVDPARLGAVGSSWGGGVTIFTAAQDRRIRCVVSLAAPADGRRWLRRQWVDQHGETGWQRFLEKLAADRTTRAYGAASQTVRLVGGFIPVPADQVAFFDEFLAAHPDMVANVPLEIADDILAFAPENAVAQVAPTPLLLVHGTADPVVASEEAQHYWAQAGQPTTLNLIEGGAHQLLSGVTAETVAALTLDWLDHYLLERR